MNKATLTVPEAARVLGIGRTTAYEAARSGELPTVRFGGRIVVLRAHLEKMLGLAPGGLSKAEGMSSEGAVANEPESNVLQLPGGLSRDV